MNLREFEEFINEVVQKLDEECEHLTIQEKHNHIYNICEAVIYAAKALERDETTIKGLIRIRDSALMNFTSAGLY